MMRQYNESKRQTWPNIIITGLIDRDGKED